MLNQKEVNVEKYRELKKMRDVLAGTSMSIDDIQDKIDEAIAQINHLMMLELGISNFLKLELSADVKSR